MSSQSDLNEFDRSGAKHPENSGRGVSKSERTNRPKCGFEDTYDGVPCESPIAPGCSRCQEHLDADETQEQDHGPLLATTKASGDTVDAVDETRCPSCQRPVPSMYLIRGGEFHQCPECGHRRNA
jgi:hypothetical protein